jgi:hypothetical protein
MGSFFRGVVSGAAKSLDRNIQDQLQFLREEASNVARIRADRKIREQEKYLEAESKMSELVKELSKKAGGYNEVQFVLDKYGVEEGTAVINQLYDNQKNYGISVKDELRVEQGDPSIKISALDIAKKYTPKMKPIPKIGDFSNLSKGIPKLLGIDPTKEIERQTSTMLEAAGVDDFETVDLPIALQGANLPEWQIYRNSDPKKERVRLVRIAHNKGKEFERTGDPEAKRQQELALSMAEVEEAFNVKENKPLTFNQVNKTIGWAGNFQKQIFNAKGVGEFKVNINGDMVQQTQSSNSEQEGIIIGINSKVIDFTNEASRAGIDPSKIRQAVTKGLMSYPPVLPVITAADGSFNFSNPDELISLDKFNKVFPENMHRSINKTSTLVERDDTTLDPFESLQKDWINSYNINNSANRQSERDTVVSKIIRMGTINPDTNRQFMDSNEVIKYLDRIAGYSD